MNGKMQFYADIGQSMFMDVYGISISIFYLIFTTTVLCHNLIHILLIQI